jgi:chorismate mutase
MAMVRAIRGATTIDEDVAEQVRERTQTLVREMLDRNEVAVDDLVSALFTATADISSAFPATAARALGLDDVPLIGAQELEVDGGLGHCIRVLLHCYSERSRSEIRHVYLEGARALRTDLAD